MVTISPKDKSLKSRCTVCRHPERVRIESLRLAGCTLEKVAGQFGLSRVSVHRHMASHVRPEMKAALIADVPLSELAAKAREEQTSLLDNLAIVRRTLMSQLLQASAINDRHALSAISGRVIEVLREIGRLTGEISNISSLTINQTSNFVLLSSPVFLEMQKAIILALAPYPEARAAVIGALRQVEDRHSPPPTIEGALNAAA